MSKINVSPDKKFCLTIEEATAYFSIGENKLREMIKEPGCDYILHVGRKTLIKRERLENFLSGTIYL